MALSCKDVVLLLKKGVIKQEEEVLAGLSQKVGGHVVLQLPGVHALHAGPASIHPVQIVQSLNDGNSSIQVHRVLGCLVKVEGALHELRPEGVLLLIGVQLAVAVQEALRQGAKGFPEGEIVPV